MNTSPTLSPSTLPASSAPSRRTRRRLRAALSVALVAALAVAVAACSGSGSGSEAAPVAVDGDMLPLFDPAAAVDPAIGLPAPRVSGVDFSGSAITVGDGPALVVFVAHWCPHCQAELPVLVDWVADGGALPIVLVATAESVTRPNHPASTWIAGEGWTGPVLRDSEASTVLAAYGMGAFPAFVAVDADGNVAGRATGPQPVEVLDGLAAALMP